MNALNMFNPLMKIILRSPLHILASKSTLLITFTGHKSKKKFSTPVNYVIVSNTIYIVSLRDRNWWKNLRGFATACVRLQGKDIETSGEVIDDNEVVAEHLMVYLQKVPQYARYFNVRLDTAGHPEREDIGRAAKDRVVILLKLVEDLQT